MKPTTIYNNALLMNAQMNRRSPINARRNSRARALFVRALAVAAALALWQSPEALAATPTGKSFATPQEAVAALERAASAASLTELRAIFGPGLDEIANPDRVQATNELATFASGLSETNRLVPIAQKRLAIEYGPEATLFPVPLVENSGRWVFDTEAGAEELINRRIGRNELAVLEVVRAYVDAQREYAGRDRDEDEVLEYAQKFGSTPGTKDGLYWPRDLDGTMSPLGPLVAEAQAVGYRKSAGAGPQPFHGYYFRILTRQGKHAPGGAYDYIINRNMIGGFALVAWPAEYDETGVMTFIVNQQGRVYQKDLGSKTAQVAESIKAYDPDKTWQPSPD
ncbi:MAG: DUF2950 domain-containing protein [Verrucomicrobia subdivision 3 bacterium]|nr:DUF2950 domain-containing protein [Limisphaerales bacterium]